MSKVKLLRYLANLGYGSRRDVLAMFAERMDCCEVGAASIWSKASVAPYMRQERRVAMVRIMIAPMV